VTITNLSNQTFTASLEDLFKEFYAEKDFKTQKASKTKLLNVNSHITKNTYYMILESNVLVQKIPYTNKYHQVIYI